MATLHIEHAITDLQTWLGAFNKFEEARRRGCARSTCGNLSMTTTTYVTLDFDTTDEAAAFKRFLETTVWASAEASPALQGSPTARVLTDVDTTR